MFFCFKNISFHICLSEQLFKFAKSLLAKVKKLGFSSTRKKRLWTQTPSFTYRDGPLTQPREAFIITKIYNSRRPRIHTSKYRCQQPNPSLAFWLLLYSIWIHDLLKNPPSKTGLPTRHVGCRTCCFDLVLNGSNFYSFILRSENSMLFNITKTITQIESVWYIINY